VLRAADANSQVSTWIIAGIRAYRRFPVPPNFCGTGLGASYSSERRSATAISTCSSNEALNIWVGARLLSYMSIDVSNYGDDLI